MSWIDTTEQTDFNKFFLNFNFGQKQHEEKSNIMIFN